MDNNGVKKHKVHYLAQFSLLVEKSDLLIHHLWNLLRGVTSDPRVLESSLGVVAHSTRVRTKLVEEVLG